MRKPSSSALSSSSVTGRFALLRRAVQFLRKSLSRSCGLFHCGKQKRRESVTEDNTEMNLASHDSYLLEIIIHQSLIQTWIRARCSDY